MMRGEWGIRLALPSDADDLPARCACGVEFDLRSARYPRGSSKPRRRRPAPQSRWTYWLRPSLVGVPLIWRALRRFTGSTSDKPSRAAARMLCLSGGAQSSAALFGVTSSSPERMVCRCPITRPTSDIKIEPTTPRPCSSTTLWAVGPTPDAASDRRRSMASDVCRLRDCASICICMRICRLMLLTESIMLTTSGWSWPWRSSRCLRMRPGFGLCWRCGTVSCRSTRSPTWSASRRLLCRST
jgi:hypothetical protein